LSEYKAKENKNLTLLNFHVIVKICIFG